MDGKIYEDLLLGYGGFFYFVLVMCLRLVRLVLKFLLIMVFMLKKMDINLEIKGVGLSMV